MISSRDEISRNTIDGGFFGEDKIIVTLRDGTELDATPVTGYAPIPAGRVWKGAKLLEELPALDATGKVHGTLPKIKDLFKYSKDELKILRDELRVSVQKRIEVASRMGRDKAHGQRQGAEQELLKFLEKYLK